LHKDIVRAPAHTQANVHPLQNIPVASSNHFFIGLFGDGSSNEITIENDTHVTVNVLYVISIYTVYCTMRKTVAILLLEKLLTRSKKIRSKTE